ncbi:hypothetical protein SSABA_v1c07870 [Spiroplasma sabaudiense Ar-1343]|uniref:Rhodanese domain-containing protein n=1 Tax=Spiroplasma sabaudiense Ar-1343 TaxID=1276257 RepID=W6AKG4_9MOLU|nr:rhodanese-like domain-containing protein [Spiroplasma sabaudiense]AHI54189.1 hypothetical protein SSABA_v1c07870 [Spiroplasma sabaudiense Ar-1343]
MKSISLQDYLQIKNKVRTIDVRTTMEVKTLLKFDWAENIYVSDLIDNFDYYFKDKNEVIITVCNAGNRSGQAADFLENQGYLNAYVLDGGIYNYYRKVK